MILVGCRNSQCQEHCWTLRRSRISYLSPSFSQRWMKKVPKLRTYIWFPMRLCYLGQNIDASKIGQRISVSSFTSLNSFIDSMIQKQFEKKTGNSVFCNYDKEHLSNFIPKIVLVLIFIRALTIHLDIFSSECFFLPFRMNKLIQSIVQFWTTSRLYTLLFVCIMILFSKTYN